MTGDELRLDGGNMSGGVVRMGDTVRRPAGPWTPAVRALLGYLHDVGFYGAPRPHGIDEQGREVLDFIPGVVAWPGHFGQLDSDDQLRRAARIIRGDFHHAVAGFTPPTDAHWQVLIPAGGDEIIAHHDLAPWNLVMGEPRWAFIDWDTAAPGTRLWDLAYAMHGFAPLSANPAFQREDAGRRLRVIADAYDLTERQRLDIIPLFSPAAPRPCMISLRCKLPGKRNRGRSCGTKAMATPGELTPSTSPSAKISGTGTCSASCCWQPEAHARPCARDLRIDPLDAN